MTKSKKMKKSTFAIVIMAILMVAMLAFGGTYAYFTANATVADAGSFSTGKVSIKGSGKLTATATNIVPGDRVFADSTSVSFTNESTVSTYVYASFALTYTGKVWSSTENIPTAIADYVGEDVTAGTAVDPTTASNEDYELGYFFTVTDMPITVAECLDGVTGLVGSNWVECGTTKGIYVLKGEAGSTFEVESDDYASGITFLTGAETVTFKNIDRHFTNGFYAGETDGELVWEEATVEISVEVEQSQSAHISFGEGQTAPTAVTPADAEKIYQAIK